MKKTIVNAVVALATLVAMPMYAQEFTWNETTHDFGTIDEAPDFVTQKIRIL